MTFTDKSAKWNCSSLCESFVLSGSCRARGFSGTSLFMNIYWQQCPLWNSFQIQITEGFGVWCWFFSPHPTPNTNYLCCTNSTVQKESCSFPDIESTCFLHQCQVSEGREPLRHSRQMVSFQVSEKSHIWQLHKHVKENSRHSICTTNEDNIKSVTNEIIFDSLLWNSNSFYFINELPHVQSTTAAYWFTLFVLKLGSA